MQTETEQHETTREQENAADSMALEFGAVRAEMVGENLRCVAQDEVTAPGNRGVGGRVGTRVVTIVRVFNPDGRIVRGAR